MSRRCSWLSLKFLNIWIIVSFCHLVWVSVIVCVKLLSMALSLEAPSGKVSCTMDGEILESHAGGAWGRTTTGNRKNIYFAKQILKNNVSETKIASAPCSGRGESLAPKSDKFNMWNVGVLSKLITILLIIKTKFEPEFKYSVSQRSHCPGKYLTLYLKLSLVVSYKTQEVTSFCGPWNNFQCHGQ